MSTWPSGGTVPTTNVDESTDDPSLARPNIKTAFDSVNSIIGAYGANDGIPTLGSTGGIPRSQLGLVLSTTGGTLTGFLTLSAAPTQNLHAATKQYVDTLGVNDDSIATTHIQALAVTSAKLAAAAVTTGKIANQSVLTADIKDANVTETKLATDAVTTTKIKDLNVTTAKINTQAVTDAKIQSGGLGAASIGAASVKRAKLDTTTGGLSGTLGSFSTLNIEMDAYSFFPNVHFDDPGGVRWEPHNVDGGSADAPRFRVRELSASNHTYNVDWRYVKA